MQTADELRAGNQVERRERRATLYARRVDRPQRAT
jgi:hypothetical protein